MIRERQVHRTWEPTLKSRRMRIYPFRPNVNHAVATDTPTATTAIPMLSHSSMPPV
jgi:hypothetical protein